MDRNNIKAHQILQLGGISKQKSAYRKKKTNEDRTLNEESFQWRKWTHTISASMKPARDDEI
jgi:hypothetical protein